MTRRGRKPTGAQLVERLEGSEHAKTRLKVILETLSGQRTIPDACEELGIQESMFHRVRSEVLQTALGRLEPRPLGRPPQAPSPQDAAHRRTGRREPAAAGRLKAAEIRRELAENLPRLPSRPTGRGKKRPAGGRSPANAVGNGAGRSSVRREAHAFAHHDCPGKNAVRSRGLARTPRPPYPGMAAPLPVPRLTRWADTTPAARGGTRRAAPGGGLRPLGHTARLHASAGRGPGCN